MPNGECGRPIQQACPHPNAFLTCDGFLTDERHLDAHRDQLERTRMLIATADANGNFRMVEMNRRVDTNLARMIEASNTGPAAMARPDNTAVLVEAAQRRSEQARSRTFDAIAALTEAGEAMTPTAVAKRAGVSRQWLYTIDEARDAIRVARLTERPTAGNSVEPNRLRRFPAPGAWRRSPRTTSVFVSTWSS